MTEILNDKLNLEILENIVSGTGVSVNISALSKSLGKHRNTIQTQVDELMKNHIISGPHYPFTEVFNERPLFAIVKADLPQTEQVEKFLKEDDAIFASFRSWDEGYNTLLLEFHKDMTSYYMWKERLVREKILPPLENRFPADVQFLDNKLRIKYDPNSSIICLEKAFRKNNELVINNYKIKELGFDILKKLLRGEGIKTNEHLLASKLNTHRRTIERRIDKFLEEGIVSKPICRFPKFFVPPNFVLVFCFIRLNKCKERIYHYMKEHCAIPIAYRGHAGRYNLLYFGTFQNVEEHFRWEEELRELFPDDCFGAMKKTYLSPRLTASIDQQKVCLGVIKERKHDLAENGL
ncbi:MAG: hypothetical protein R6W91_04750 [Thermoplasmata archaeon]